MITTHQTKQGLYNGYFNVGNPTSQEVVLMVGSCRGVPHLNFLDKYNNAHGRPFLIYYIDPFDYHWDAAGNRIDMNAAIDNASKSAPFLDLMKRTTIFIHEHFGRYGAFNTDRSAETNIYQFGLKPRLDISLPNFHDRFILFQSIVDMDAKARALAKADGDTLSESTFNDFRQRGLDAMEAWKKMCQLTSFPEFADYFENMGHLKRFFWNHNHVTNHFTIPLFQMMCEKFLGLQLPENFYQSLYAVDMYDSAEKSPLTDYDVRAHGWEWNEPIKPLKLF